MENKTELLPCRKCGGSASVTYGVSVRGDNVTHWWRAQCTQCDEMADVTERSANYAAALWNAQQYGLQPCPKCGGKAVRIRTRYENDNDIFGVSCPDCGYEGHESQISEYHAINYWNRRCAPVYKIAPCRQCGTIPTENDVIHIRNGNFLVICPSCYKIGEPGPTAGDAITAWNVENETPTPTPSPSSRRRVWLKRASHLRRRNNLFELRAILGSADFAGCIREVYRMCAELVNAETRAQRLQAFFSQMSALYGEETAAGILKEAEGYKEAAVRGRFCREALEDLLYNTSGDTLSERVARAEKLLLDTRQ